MQSVSEQAQKILMDGQLLFESKNGGNHLVVETYATYVDYWPTTGKWKARDSERSGFGIHQLLRFHAEEFMQ